MEPLNIDRNSFLFKPLSIIPLVFIVGLFGFYLLLSYLRKAPRLHATLPLPPGPPQVPLLGNIFNAPFHFSWLVHYQWRHTYGPVVYYKVAGRSVIVLTTVEAAHELLNKRASNYSGRSFSLMAGKLVSKGYNMLFRQYDAQLRLHQRIHVHGMNPRSAALYHPVQKLESLQLLHDLLSEQKENICKESGEDKQSPPAMNGRRPQDPRWHFQRASASVVSVLAWGYRLLRGNPEHRAQIEFFNNCPTSVVLKSPPRLVDIFTWLEHLLYLISPWERAGKDLHEHEASHHVSNFRNALNQPGYNLSKQIVNSTQRLQSDMSETEMAWVTGTLTLANGDTSMSILSWFVVAMLTYPHVMHKAQAMLDEVVGREKLPMFEERGRLPYIDAIIEEVMRWRPILPSGMDHAVASDDEYNGYRIPKGATVVASMWAITRDKEAFGADCDDFRPERWLERDDLPTLSFGYGRRLCPGRHVGREGLWILFARLLWAFVMETPTDPITLKRRVVDPMDMPPFGLVIGPQSFEALFNPRGAWVEEVIQKEFEAQRRMSEKSWRKLRPRKVCKLGFS